MLSGTIFDSRIKSESVTSKEKVLGYFLGPVSVSLMVSILNTYLNVYYTDVLQLGTLWGGTFLSLFPVISKILGAVFFLFMGRIVDQTNSPQGKARPWILISAPVLLSGMVLLFFVRRAGPGHRLHGFLSAIICFIPSVILPMLLRTRCWCLWQPGGRRREMSCLWRPMH